MFFLEVVALLLGHVAVAVAPLSALCLGFGPVLPLNLPRKDHWHVDAVSSMEGSAWQRQPQDLYGWGAEQALRPLARGRNPRRLIAAIGLPVVAWQALPGPIAGACLHALAGHVPWGARVHSLPHALE